MHGNCHVTCFIDDDVVRVHPVHTDAADRRPYIYVGLGSDLSLWGHNAAAFRRIATAFIEAADTLERTAESLRTAAQDDAERVALAIVDAGARRRSEG